MIKGARVMLGFNRNAAGCGSCSCDGRDARVARSQPMRACEVRLRDEWGGGGLVSSISERTWPRNLRDVLAVRVVHRRLP